MDTKKIIAVIGATGAQGGGLVRAILSDPDHEYHVRAITRDVDSDKAKELVKMGAEVVAADLDNIIALRRLFMEPTAPFVLLSSGTIFRRKKKIIRPWRWPRHLNLKEVKHIIWSTLDDTRKLIPFGR